MKKYKDKKNPNKRISVSVEEIKNGYVISKYTSWEDDKGYHSEDEKWYSKENPFEEVEDNEDDGEENEKLPVWALFK